ncbi:MAG: hypothetical protein Q9217_003903 [Psora testacea]
MPSQPYIPPVLSPYLSIFSSGSLILLTGTVGASTNWLLLRFVAASLKGKGAKRLSDGLNLHSNHDGDVGKVSVTLASWLREADFWKDGGRKLGIDFQKVTIIDAFSSNLGLDTNDLAALKKEILRAVGKAKEGPQSDEQVLLILDGLDFLLSATACQFQDLLDTVNELREHVHSTIVTVSADSPLLQTHASSTPLEVAHAAFGMSLAHQANMVVSVRELDTGGARDVSGVVRINSGGIGKWEDENEGEEREYLYNVGGDGGVRVFERDYLAQDEYVPSPRGRLAIGCLLTSNTSIAKGTSSFGKRHNKTHTLCRRCGKQSLYGFIKPRYGNHILPTRPASDPFKSTKRELTPKPPISLGRRSLHIQKHTCASCGYPAAKIRQYNWGVKAKRRKTTGTGRMRHMKDIPRKFKNGFQTGAPKGARGTATNPA